MTAKKRNGRLDLPLSLRKPVRIKCTRGSISNSQPDEAVELNWQAVTNGIKQLCANLSLLRKHLGREDSVLFTALEWKWVDANVPGLNYVFEDKPSAGRPKRHFTVYLRLLTDLEVMIRNRPKGSKRSYAATLRDLVRTHPYSEVWGKFSPRTLHNMLKEARDPTCNPLAGMWNLEEYRESARTEMIALSRKWPPINIRDSDLRAAPSARPAPVCKCHDGRKSHEQNYERKSDNDCLPRPRQPARVDPKNPRVHSRQQIRKLADSIRTFGFNAPILINKDGVVVAGHARLEASKLLGLDQVPTICLEHLSLKQQQAYLIADNRLSEMAVWDDALLAETSKSLAEVELDFDIEATGFDLGDIEVRIFDDASAEPEPEITEREIADLSDPDLESGRSVGTRPPSTSIVAMLWTRRVTIGCWKAE